MTPNQHNWTALLNSLKFFNSHVYNTAQHQNISQLWLLLHQKASPHLTMGTNSSDFAVCKNPNPSDVIKLLFEDEFHACQGHLDICWSSEFRIQTTAEKEKKNFLINVIFFSKRSNIFSTWKCFLASSLRRLEWVRWWMS